MSILYPTDLPTADIKAAISILEGGPSSIEQGRAALAKHVWMIQGYALDVVFGDPDATLSPPRSGLNHPLVVVAPGTPHQALSASLSELVSAVESPIKAISPTLIVTILELAIQVLQLLPKKG